MAVEELDDEALFDQIAAEGQEDEEPKEAEAAEAQGPEADEPQQGQAPEPETDFHALAKRLDSLASRFDNGLRDLNGKYGGLNQQLGQFREELAAAKQAAATARADGGGPTNAQVTRAASEKAAGDSKLWDQMMEEFPDIAKAVDARLSQATAGLKQETPKPQATEPAKDPRIDDLLADKSRRDYEREVELVRTKHPDFEQIAADQKWSEFVAGLPQQLQEMANGTNGSDVSFVIDLFKSKTGTDQSASAQKNADRTNRLSRAVAAPRGQSQTRTVKSFDDMTEEEQFAVLARQEEARRQR